MLKNTVRGRLGLSVFAAVATAAALAAPASAGTYDVVACGAAPGDANHSWTPSSSSPSTLQTHSACSDGGAYAGLAVTDVLQSADTPDGASASWTFTAPTGTTITALRYDRYAGKNGDANWIVGGELGDGTHFDDCTFDFGQDECSVGASGPGSGGATTKTGLSTDSISFGVRCHATGTGITTCLNGFSLQHAWAALYSATVTLSDASAPTVSSASGALTSDSGYRRGAQTATIDAADNSGIRKTSVYVDGVQYGASSRTCDFTYVRPCSDLTGAVVSLDTADVPDGAHRVAIAVTDAAGNEARTAATAMTFDNTAPSEPIGLGVVGGAISTSNRFDVQWTNPGGQVAPLTTVHYQLCGGSCQPERSVALTTSLPGLAVPSAGSWTLRVWLEDAAGNVDPSTAATTSLVYAPPVSGGASGSTGASGGGGSVGGGSTKPPPVESPSPAASAAPTPVLIPPAVDPPPADQTPARRRAARLRIRTAKRRGRTVRVVGSARARAHGRVRVTYSQRVHGHILRQGVTVRIRHGRFRAKIRLWRRFARARRAVVRVVYPGNRRTRRASARVRLRMGRAT